MAGKKNNPTSWPTIEEIYQANVAAVWRFIHSRVHRDSHAADEITSTVFMALVDGIDQFDPDQSSATAWVFAIARHKLADYLRQHYRERERRKELHEDKVGEYLNKGGTIEEDEKTVDTILQKMPPHERNVLIWKYCDQLSVRQIAERMGRSEKACETLLSRSRNRFRELFNVIANKEESDVLRK